MRPSFEEYKHLLEGPAGDEIRAGLMVSLSKARTALESVETEREMYRLQGRAQQIRDLLEEIFEIVPDDLKLDAENEEMDHG